MSDSGKEVDDELEESDKEMAEVDGKESKGEEPTVLAQNLEDAEEDLDLGGELGGNEDEHPET